MKHQRELFPEASTDGTPLFALLPELELRLIDFTDRHNKERTEIARRWYVRTNRPVDLRDEDELHHLFHVCSIWPEHVGGLWYANYPHVRQVGKRIIIKQRCYMDI